MPESDQAPDGASAPQPALVKVSAQTLSLVTLAILGVFWALSVAAEIVVPLMLALMLKLMLQPAMRLLCEQLRLPQGLAAVLLIAGLFGLLAAIGAAIALPASGWITKAPQGLKTLEEQLSPLRQPIALLQYFMQQAEHMALPDAGMATPVASAPPTSAPTTSALGSMGISVLLGTQHFLGRLFILVVSLFFMLAAGDSMLRKLVVVIPRFQQKKQIVTITNEIERNISAYLVTITGINAAFGVVIFATTYLCGLSDPLLWGTVAFLLNFIPIVGPLIGIAVIFVVGLLTFGHPLPALIPPVIYLAAHIVEGQLVTPMLLARRFLLSPLIVIVSLIFWNWLWGIPGALLSVPLLATFKIICDRIPSLAALGHMLGEPPRRSPLAEDDASA